MLTSRNRWDGLGESWAISLGDGEPGTDADAVLIAGDLFELTRGERTGRTSVTEITLFKSVGMALEDLAAAELTFCKHQAAAG